MPHKHTRRKGADDGANFDLAPSTIALPLPTTKPNRNSKQSGKEAKGPKKSVHKSYAHADTPRAFTRLISYSTQKRPSSSLDDGNEDARPAKKKKQNKASEPGTFNNSTSVNTPTEPPQQPPPEIPKILPGERLGDYAARVDHALPIAGLARKGKIKVEGMKERQTRTEKRLQKMYADWRAEEARLKEKEEEAREKEEEEDEEREAKYGTEVNRAFESGGKRKGKKGRKKVIGEVGGGDDDEDPWAVLKTRREERKGLHDVAQAPPVLKPVKEKFKVRDGAKVQVLDVPNKAGSLKKREELGEARREVIERYRAMMKGSRQSTL